MKTLPDGCNAFEDARDARSTALPSPDPLESLRLIGPVRHAIGQTRQWLLAAQQDDGHWVGELEGDTILESEFVLLQAFLGREDSDRARRAAEYLIEKQMPAGGWSMYPGGRLEISGSVKAYFALKLTGHDPSAEYMQRAKAAILAHGGADAVNSYTRYYLALLGQISYEQCPVVPPEVMLLPKWFPVNLYSVSAWSRTIIVPLSIMSSHRPVRRLDAEQGIRELFLREPEDWPPPRCPDLPGGTGLLSWDRFFRTVDSVLKWCRRHGVTPLRRRAIEAARRWMLARLERSDGLGAIFPPIVWSIVALRCLGYDDESPELAECFRQLDGLVIEDEQTDSIRLQPCKSPVWDTALVIRSLAAAGLERDHPAMARGVRWLLDKQILAPGDWSETVDAEPGGWAFEYQNDFYPDVDDTALALAALQTQFEQKDESADALPPDLRLTEENPPIAEETTDEALARLERSTQAVERGLRWVLAMQNRDGGWGAFDRNNDRKFLCYVPFADHNAIIDPSTPDLTGHVLSTLGELGLRVGDPAVDRAVGYLRRTQEANGSWFGRWGVNYLYGTGEALGGLGAVGVPAGDPMVARAVNWLLCCQQPSGGWGESADSYEKHGTPGAGPETASQTAWALLGLLASGLENHAALARGVRFLVDRQRADGDWDEPEFTGTGFPKVFYLRYHYYRIYFPLLALARWAVTATSGLSKIAAPTLRVVAADEEPVDCRSGCA
ncbi:MAG TPA: prenyltransferase/squalene oxidase repeat-containing protein [Thermoguttaceae bacterium]|nr:prenyltransferase/squalene oxidase repeat-containing protein [Thermoguttaceae bacterium]